MLLSGDGDAEWAARTAGRGLATCLRVVATPFKQSFGRVNAGSCALATTDPSWVSGGET
jgi:hypothetical protein